MAPGHVPFLHSAWAKVLSKSPLIVLYLGGTMTSVKGHLTLYKGQLIIMSTRLSLPKGSY